MRGFIYLLFLSAVFSCQSSHWDYKHENTAHSWAALSNNYEACQSGKKQSPIDLSRSKSQDFNKKIDIKYKDEYAEIINDGHTIKEHFKTNNYISIDKKNFFLQQLHFHSHSEHSLDGIYYPLEIHLVHRSKDNEIAVLGIFVEITSLKKNEFGFFKHINSGKSLIKLSKIQNLNGEHFYYEGSLTTPPCSESVQWIILDKHVQIERSQLEPYKKHYRNNYRPVNQIKDHVLYHSNI